jgi:repressor LexA
MTALTDRQADALEFILAHFVEHQQPPTWREIGDHLGITSTNGVNDKLNALHRKGYLSLPMRAHRSLVVKRNAQGWPVTYTSRGLWFAVSEAA